MLKVDLSQDVGENADTRGDDPQDERPRKMQQIEV